MLDKGPTAEVLRSFRVVTREGATVRLCMEDMATILRCMLRNQLLWFVDRQTGQVVSDQSATVLMDDLLGIVCGPTEACSVPRVQGNACRVHPMRRLIVPGTPQPT